MEAVVQRDQYADVDTVDRSWCYSCLRVLGYKTSVMDTHTHGRLSNGPSHGPVLLAQAGRDALINYKFVLEAPWKACRLCGKVFQSDLDREAYKRQQAGDNDIAAYFERQGKIRRQNWERTHNKYEHPSYDNEVRLLEISGLPVTPLAAGVLSTYGIIPIGPTTYEDEVSQALIEAPRAPVNDAEN